MTQEEPGVLTFEQGWGHATVSDEAPVVDAGEEVGNQASPLSESELTEQWDATRLPRLSKDETGQLVLEGKPVSEWSIESLQMAAEYFMQGAHEFPNRGTLNQVLTLGLELQNKREVEEQERQAREHLMSEMTKTTRAESATVGDEILIPKNPENQQYPSVLTEDGTAALEYTGEANIGGEGASVSAYVFRIVRPCTIVKNGCTFAIRHGVSLSPFSEHDVMCKDRTLPEHSEQ